MRPSIASLVAGLFALAIGVGDASAEKQASFLSEWLQRLQHELEQASLARKPRPPKPVEVRFRTQKLGTLSLRAPLLEMQPADLDGDGKSELVLLTSTDVLVLAPTGQKSELQIIQTLPLPDKPAAIRSRDPVGVLIAEPRAGAPRFRVRTSEQATGIQLEVRSGVLVTTNEITGFPLCEYGTVELALGRNYFVATSLEWPEPLVAIKPPRLSEAFYSTRCDTLIDPRGLPIRVTSSVSVDRVLTTDCHSTGDGAPCSEGPAVGQAFEGSGVAHLVVDLNSDGFPEVVSTQGGAPGQPDRVNVYSRISDKGRLYSKAFAGGVVGLVAPDLDGDGAIEVVAAVRLVGTGEVTFWRLN